MKHLKNTLIPVLFFIITFSLLFLMASNASNLKSNIVSTLIGVEK